MTNGDDGEPRPRILEADRLTPGSQERGLPSDIVETVLPPVAERQTSEIEVRKNISYALIALLALVVIVALIVLVAANVGASTDAGADYERLSSLLNIVFGPIVALVSSVVGFYFGAKTVSDVAKDAKAGG